MESQTIGTDKTEGRAIDAFNFQSADDVSLEEGYDLRQVNTHNL